MAENQSGKHPCSYNPRGYKHPFLPHSGLPCRDFVQEIPFGATPLRKVPRHRSMIFVHLEYLLIFLFYPETKQEYIG
jgi:hypothetical protein